MTFNHEIYSETASLVTVVYSDWRITSALSSIPPFLPHSPSPSLHILFATSPDSLLSSPSLLTLPPHPSSPPPSPSLHPPSSPSLLTSLLHLPSSPSLLTSLLTLPPHLPPSPSLLTLPHPPSSPSPLTFPPPSLCSGSSTPSQQSTFFSSNKRTVERSHTSSYPNPSRYMCSRPVALSAPLELVHRSSCTLYVYEYLYVCM